MDGSSRDNDLASLDHNLVSILVSNDSDSLALVDQHALNEGVLHKVGAVVLGIMQEGHHGALFLSIATSEPTPSTRVLLESSVLGNVLGRVSELVASLQKKSVGGVVL